MPNLDATPFIQITAARGRKRMGKLPRVLLSGSTVDVATAKQLKAWGRACRSVGVALDQLVSHAKRKGFRPDRKRSQ